MKARTHWIKLISAAVICLAVVSLTVISKHVGAQEKRGLSVQENRGKQIYLKGDGGTGGEITAILGSDNLELPAVSFTCAGCHGMKGEGQQEGGLQPPPINWETLTSPHISALTNHKRSPYNEVTLARAIKIGLDSGGIGLHPGMPHYVMTPEQLADLIAYLKIIGTEVDADSGLGEATIKVGAVLPMSGHLMKIGEDVKATLDACFAEVNAQGGVYGRQIELIVEDSGGEPARTAEATRRLVEQDGAFALVGSFEPPGSQATNEFLKRSEIPLIGPTTLSPRLSFPPNRYVFYLLPTFSDQARVLVDFIASKVKGRSVRLAVIYSNNEFDADALSGLRSQAKMYPMPIVSEQGYDARHFSAIHIVETLAAKKPDYVFFFGSADQITSLAREMERAKLNAVLLSSISMIGHGAFGLPPTVAAQTFLAYPAAMPDQNDFAEFAAVMQKAGARLSNPAFQVVAFAAAKTFIEATKLSSREISRPALISALEQLRDFRTGVVPPISFGPNRRVGAEGSYIVGIDLNQKRYVPLGDRIIPKDNP